MGNVTERCLRAFEDGQEDVLKLLPKVDQPQTVKDDGNQTLVHFAAWHGWHSVCRTLVEDYHLNPAEKDDHGLTPLHLACRRGHAQVVKYLLAFPTVLLTVNDEDHIGDSALDRTCAYGHLPVVEILVQEPFVKMPTKNLPSAKFSVLSLLSSRIEWSTQFTMRPYFTVFMAGNSAAGKTTLATAIVNLDPISSSSSSRHCGLVSGVKTLTAGICPTQCSG